MKTAFVNTIAGSAARLAACVLALVAVAATGAWGQETARQPAVRVLERPKLPPPPEVNEERAQAAGIRKLVGAHLTLYTDVPRIPEVDELPQVFDAAYPEWCKYFAVDEEHSRAWRMQGYLMKDKEKFLAAGLLPADLPIDNGYTRNYEFWMFEQPGDYYRRHLMLHEGTHGFMYTQLGGVSAPWYFEGLAELFGTHRWQDGKLTTGYFPASAEEVPYHGRIKLIKQAWAEKRALRLENVTEYGPDVHKKNEAYAWCWAAAVLLDAHPRYQERFRALYTKMQEPGEFSKHFREAFDKDWNDLAEEWQVFMSSLDYGYDVPRSAMEFKRGDPLAVEGAVVKVAADRGWQGSGIKLEKGNKYRLTASGRFEIAQGKIPWISEANGVSIKYYFGLPVGTLLAAVRPDDWDSSQSSVFLRPLTIGLGTEIEVPATGDLYLKINDSPAELGDNKGELEVRVAPHGE